MSVLEEDIPSEVQGRNHLLHGEEVHGRRGKVVRVKAQDSEMAFKIVSYNVAGIASLANSLLWGF